MLRMLQAGLGLLLVASACSGGDDAVTTTSTAAATTMSATGATFSDRMETIEAMVTARNSGDFDAWRAFFPAEAPVIWASTVQSESDLDWQRSYMAAHEVWTITGDCQEQGVGAVRISCPMTLVNQFFSPAGLYFTAQVSFDFNDEGEISSLASNSWHIAGDVGEYTEAFDTWLAETHPEVHASFGPRVEGEQQLPSAPDMSVALGYVDEFVAQSDTYPFVAEEVELVIEAIDVYNTGSFDAWLEFWAADPDEDYLFSRSVMNSGEHIEVTAPCQAAPNGAGSVVTCAIYVEDDFHGAGNLTSAGTMQFYVNDAGLIFDTSSTTYEEADGTCCPRWEAFHVDFHAWLREAHPDVYAEIGPGDSTPSWYLPGVASGDAAHMLIALEYVDEFVAQSDTYPLDQ